MTAKKNGAEGSKKPSTSGIAGYHGQTLPLSADKVATLSAGREGEPNETIKHLRKQTAFVVEEMKRKASPELHQIMPFPVEVFPPLFQQVIKATSTHMQFQIDWISSCILYAVSVATGNTYGADYNGYLQKSTIYLAIVGDPGLNKSGPPEYALAPIYRCNAKAYLAYKAEKETFDYWESLPKKQRQQEGLPDRMRPPTFKTMLVSDVTPEGLSHTHQNNPAGLGLFMDELAAWFNNFNRYQKGSEEQFWLSNWSFAPVSVVRKTSAPLLINKPFISICGTIQPGVLGELAKDKRNQNGFIDRILFSFPDDAKILHDAETGLSSAITHDYENALSRLLGLRDFLLFDENGDPQTKYLSFHYDAFRAIRNWKNENIDRRNECENPAMKGILSKLEVYCIRFALLIELMDYSCEQSDLTAIRLSSVERAITLTAYFEVNAQKVFYRLNEQTAAELLPKNQQGLYNTLPDVFTKVEAIKLGSQQTPAISESTVKRFLRNEKVFRRVSHGKYEKR